MRQGELKVPEEGFDRDQPDLRQPDQILAAVSRKRHTKIHSAGGEFMVLQVVAPERRALKPCEAPLNLL